MRAEAEERAKAAKETQDAINRTKELSKSVEELAEEYYTLKDAGESTYEVLDKMRDQAADLAERYRELAEVLGVDLTGALAEYQLALNAGDVDRAEQIRQEIEKGINQAQTSTSKEAYGAAAEGLVAAGTGAIQGDRYTSKRFTGGSFSMSRLSENESAIVDKYLGDYLTTQQVGNGGGEAGWFEVDANAQAMLQYYKDLTQAQKELAAAGETGSALYKNISKEVEALAPKVEEFSNASKESLSVFATDIDEKYANTSISMTEFMNNHDQLIQEIKDGYGVLSDAEAEQILNLTELMGLQEKLYES